MTLVGTEPESSGSRLLRNTIVNAGAGLVTAVLAFALTPLLLQRLGPAAYGVWLLATALTFGSGYLGLADLGLQQTVVRLVADARARRDVDAVNEVLASTLVVFVVLGGVLAVGLAASAGLLVDLFSIDPELRGPARLVFGLVGLQIALDLPSAAFLAIVEGAQRYGSLRVVDVGGRVLWALGIVVALALGSGVVALAVVSLTVAALSLALSIHLARRSQVDLRVSPTLARVVTLRRLLSSGSSLLALRVLSVLNRQMDRVIVGIALSASAVARYEVAYKVHAMAALVLSIAPSAVVPAAAHLAVTDDRERLRALYLRGTKYAVALSLPVTVAALLYTRPILTAWVGRGYDDLAGVTRLFLLYPALVVVHVVGLTMLVGLGRMREMVVLNAISVGLNLCLSVALVHRLGIAGVVWGTLAGYAVLWVPYLRLFWQQFDVDAAAWLREVAAPNALPLVAQVGVGLATLGLADSLTQWWQVGLLVGSSWSLSVAVFARAGLGPGEGARLLQELCKGRSRLPTGRASTKGE